MNASEEFLGQRDDDARRASHVAELVQVLVLDHLADDFGAVGSQAGHGVVEVFDREHDLPEAQRVRRSIHWLGPDQRRVAKLRQLDPPVAVRGPHHGDVDLDAFEPIEAVHPGALDRPLAFQRHAESSEEANGGCEVVDDDADMVHSLDRHVPSFSRGNARLSRLTVLTSWMSNRTG
jgi:hypothetical protein